MPQRIETIGDGMPCDLPPRTLGEAIAAHALSRPEAPAIVLPDLSRVTYRALQQQVERVNGALRRAGIGAKHRVAIVMPDGGDLAATIATVACHATVVPLNPGLTAAEIDDLFVSHSLDAIILPEGAETPARMAARKRGACFFEASLDADGINLTLKTPPFSTEALEDKVALGDAVMILRTSGTMGHAKLVPMTHRYLNVMAAQRQHWFGLGPNDRALAAAPVYYSQGSNVLVATLMLGGSLACPARTPGANFCDWLDQLAPTWYSAGPTFHRSVLDQALARPRHELRHSLRFIQSAAAPLPEALQAGLETVFGVPVCEGYGMTETGNITANAIAPDGRRAGTLGKAYGIDLALRDEDGSILARGGPAEIVVRGPGVTPGYIDDEATNRTVFVDGWFHTGDVGCIDEDGFLTLVGRVKEMINRGGEKLAPAEIDEALQRHPAIAEAAAFPVPHPRLGEDVAAAVTLRPGATASPLELRRFLQQSLVAFKIPRRIHLVSRLPKGDTGKVLRQALTRSFSADAGDAAGAAASWGSALEIEIAQLWERLLNRSGIGPEDDFFELGGDSLLATQMLLELERLTGSTLPDTLLFEAATVRELAESLVHKEAAGERGLMVQLQPGTGKTPFFFIDGDFWGGGYYARKIAQLVGAEYPFYSLRSHGLSGAPIPSIERMARDYKDLIKAAGIKGPFRIGGHCNGGLIALALADQFEAEGQRVELIALVDALSFNARPLPRLAARALDRLLRLGIREASVREARLGAAMSLLWRVMRKAGTLSKPREAAEAPPAAQPGARAVNDETPRVLALKIEETNQALAAQIKGRFMEYHRVMAGYLPPALSAELLVLVAQSHGENIEYTSAAWRNIAGGGIEIATIPGDHLTCLTTHADALTARLRECFVRLDHEAARQASIADTPSTALRSPA